MTHRSRGLAGAALYVALVSVPLAVALAPPYPPGRSFWIELSIALGFVALGQMAVEYALIGRFAAISRPYGIDRVMAFHRRMGILAVAVVLAHPLILALRLPRSRALLDPLGGPLANRLGWLSLLALGALVAVTLGRRRLRLEYEAWRLIHALLALTALGLAFTHAALAGGYLAAPWKRTAVGSYCLLFLALVVHLRLVRPALLTRRPYAVAGVRAEGAETWAVEMVPLGHPGLRFAPGQFAWIRFGVSPWSLREHPFSFTSSAERPQKLEIGIRELGDFTRTIGSLPLGTRAYVDGPHGSFSTDFEPADSFLFVAGGIGISPILSMLRTLADRGDSHPHVLVYAAVRRERIAFQDEVEAVRAELDLEIVYVLEREHDGWSGATGYVGDEVLGPRVRSPGGRPRTAFVCGPEAMMTAVEASLVRCGLPVERIHRERFDLA